MQRECLCLPAFCNHNRTLTLLTVCSRISAPAALEVQLICIFPHPAINKVDARPFASSAPAPLQTQPRRSCLCLLALYNGHERMLLNVCTCASLTLQPTLYSVSANRCRLLASQCTSYFADAIRISCYLCAACT